MNHDPCILQLLLALVSTYRYDGADSVDMELARSEAKAVHEAVRDGGGAGGHEELIRVVGTRSKAQLRATFGCFKDEHRRSVAKALPRGTDPTGYLRALRAAVRCVADPTKYFAKVREVVGRYIYDAHRRRLVVDYCHCIFLDIIRSEIDD